MSDSNTDEVKEKVKGKRGGGIKNQFLSLKAKIDILNKLNDGVKPVRIAKEYGIAMSTISRLKKCKTSLREAINMYQNNSERRSLRGTFHPKMEKALHQWYTEQIESGEPVTSCKLRLKARELNKQIRENDLEFRASSGWMEKFKKRYGIRLKSMRGERQTTDNIAFEYDEHDNYDDNGPETEEGHTIAHVEVKSETDRDFLYEPQFVTVGDGHEPTVVDRVDTNIRNPSEFTNVMHCVDQVIQWGVDNQIEALYLTMLRSLRERIRYQARS